jgi:hypothetical protein
MIPCGSATDATLIYGKAIVNFIILGVYIHHVCQAKHTT